VCQIRHSEKPNETAIHLAEVYSDRGVPDTQIPGRATASQDAPAAAGVPLSIPDGRENRVAPAPEPARDIMGTGHHPKTAPPHAVFSGKGTRAEGSGYFARPCEDQAGESVREEEGCTVRVITRSPMNVTRRLLS
jgi:hypothetical protein